MGKKDKMAEYSNDEDNINDNKGSYNYRMFSFFNRKFKITEPEPPADVQNLFAQYSEGHHEMTVDQFRSFLAGHQSEPNCTLEEAERLVAEVLHRRHHLTRYARNGLKLDDFFQFLLSDDLNGPINKQVHHDMCEPLSHYFIYTGHNSYLTGNQLSSDCSEVPIVRALQRGVRVIELDLWPNSSKDEVLVLHGRTLTTPVSLFKCLKSIRDYAFVRSPYPVIITLEDHLTPELQEKVAEMLVQIFGDMLYYPESDSLIQLPSPELLKYRVMISTKPPKEYLESSGIKQKGTPRDNGSEDDDDDEDGIGTSETEANCGRPSSSEQEDEDPSDCRTSGQLNSPGYKRLITIHAGKPKGALKDALQPAAEKVRRLSLSEQELEKAATTNGTDGYGKLLWLMHGMFKANGGCGYVKKPDLLMKKGINSEVFDPKKKLLVQKRLKVKVYLGDGWRLDFSHTHFDAYSPPDFYTKIYIVGAAADSTRKKTRIIEDNWSPVWNEEFTFPLTLPELALLRIEVREYDMSEKDDFGGQTCLPVSELRQGIRSVHLHDKKGEKLKNVKLLMGFELL
ncbi:unnamed protein product [Linum tenue]|uniref:Phosphoinositide phospholipase C n=1 Tax=Linum tenue TaxID=586396 RepID=A0AAV0MCY5_9ROSI|nr:unnamed protein product [Linum tenue]